MEKGSAKLNDVKIYDVRVNDMVNPIGIEYASPVFSWKVQTDVVGWMQTAYRIVVSQSDAVVWDSGKVESDVSVGILFSAELTPCLAYTWTLEIWDNFGNTISSGAWFETGLPTTNPFGNAKWISCDVSGNCDIKQLPAFRKVVHVRNDLVSARLYTSGLGVYESFINGKRVGRIAGDGTVVKSCCLPALLYTGVITFSRKDIRTGHSTGSGRFPGGVGVYGLTGAI